MGKFVRVKIHHKDSFIQLFYQKKNAAKMNRGIGCNFLITQMLLLWNIHKVYQKSLQFYKRRRNNQRAKSTITFSFRESRYIVELRQIATIFIQRVSFFSFFEKVIWKVCLGNTILILTSDLNDSRKLHWKIKLCLFEYNASMMLSYLNVLKWCALTDARYYETLWLHFCHWTQI